MAGIYRLCHFCWPVSVDYLSDYDKFKHMLEGKREVSEHLRLSPTLCWNSKYSLEDAWVLMDCHMEDCQHYLSLSTYLEIWITLHGQYDWWIIVHYQLLNPTILAKIRFKILIFALLLWGTKDISNWITNETYIHQLDHSTKYSYVINQTWSHCHQQILPSHYG